ncbi:DUF4179 domain-containing protein [Paenibacillus flagellatus]|uniref:DUF4179 domain-containing protein n=1 Tax=Paenibacillus flagellatus TaxID=2211139 RepID=A0A2V5K4I5_9BACL|nr:DUF4179 domain-containing protein [Paenibacillus flagellatus]PYI52603.1 hypothetical protein DLM86_20755 [Paenibacillus flagellatus]
MKRDRKLQMELSESIDRIAVPDSLYRFAEQVPGKVESGEWTPPADSDRPPVAEPARPRSRIPAWLKGAAVATIAVVTFSAGVKVSPAFASYMKSVPGFEIAVDWLTQVRERDGVQKAVDNGYTPIEPVTVRFGGTTVKIGDIYLTDEELLFKAFIRTDEFDVTDGRRSVDLWVHPDNVKAGGSTTGSSIAETADSGESPVLQVSYKYHLEPGEARRLVESGERELRFAITRHTSDSVKRQTKLEQAAVASVPFDPGKLLHNRGAELRQALPLPVGDPDWKELAVEKLTIQPTTMNVRIAGKEGWDLSFPRDVPEAPYLKDDKGNVYRYDPSGPGLLLDDGKFHLPFSSSVFFDRDVRSLTLHIGDIIVGEYEPSASFALSTKDTFPKTVNFKGKDIVIEGAEFHEEGYLMLKIKKERPEQTGLAGVSFDLSEKGMAHPEMERTNELRERLGIDGFGIAQDYSGKPYLALYLPTSERESYTVFMRRVNDRIVVNRDYPLQWDE